MRFFFTSILQNVISCSYSFPIFTRHLNGKSSNIGSAITMLIIIIVTCTNSHRHFSRRPRSFPMFIFAQNLSRANFRVSLLGETRVLTTLRCFTILVDRYFRIVSQCVRWLTRVKKTFSSRCSSCRKGYDNIREMTFCVSPSPSSNAVLFLFISRT